MGFPSTPLEAKQALGISSGISSGGHSFSATVTVDTVAGEETNLFEKLFFKDFNVLTNPAP